MGFQENENGSSKKYMWMNPKKMEEENHVVSYKENGNRSSNKYVLVCAIFASLNSVLLGYGW